MKLSIFSFNFLGICSDFESGCVETPESWAFFIHISSFVLAGLSFFFRADVSCVTLETLKAGRLGTTHSPGSELIQHTHILAQTSTCTSYIYVSV